MDMYEARQNKGKVSRRIDGGGGMTRQRVKMERGMTIIQLQRSIKVENTKTKRSVYGYSSSTMPEDYHDFNFIFEDVNAWYYPKKGIRGSPSVNEKENYYKREPYYCAEPHALLKLWKEEKAHIENNTENKIKWLKYVSFPDIASKDNEIKGSASEPPCNVCSQWLTSSPPLKIKVVQYSFDMSELPLNFPDAQKKDSQTNAPRGKNGRIHRTVILSF